ncbi:MAG: DUF177 domain-containing protein [Dehalococcoidia bacterium]
MQFNVAHLLKGSVGTSQQHTLNVTFVPQENPQIGHVSGRVRLMRVDQGVWVSGSLDATTMSSCSRCLQDVSVPVKFQLDDIYFSLVDFTTGAPIRHTDEIDPGFIIDDHHVLDITDAVRQSTVLALPMKPLCQPECSGICPHCGVNRNEVDCACESGVIDPRWAPLLNHTTLRTKEVRSL